MLEYSLSLKYGYSRRKLSVLTLAFGEIQKIEGLDRWLVSVAISGVHDESRKLEASTPFFCTTLGLAFLRQSLRRFKLNDPKLRFYEDNDEGLSEIQIDEIFDTYDCITDEMEEMINWALENGYESSS